MPKLKEQHKIYSTNPQESKVIDMTQGFLSKEYTPKRSLKTISLDTASFIKQHIKQIVIPSLFAASIYSFILWRKNKKRKNETLEQEQSQNLKEMAEQLKQGSNDAQ